VNERVINRFPSVRVRIAFCVVPGTYNSKVFQTKLNTSTLLLHCSFAHTLYITTLPSPHSSLKFIPPFSTSAINVLKKTAQFSLSDFFLSVLALSFSSTDGVSPHFDSISLTKVLFKKVFNHLGQFFFLIMPAVSKHFDVEAKRASN
jgi:hypothetical protein